MKNTFVIAVVGAFLALQLFVSCTGDAANRSTLQDPGARSSGEPVKENESGENAGTNPQNNGAGSAGLVIGNLEDAFTGETTASAKYAAYAQKAASEGLPQIAILFKAASASENIHANNHKSALEDLGATVPVVKPVFTVKSTRENLQDAIAGESYEVSTMYPAFLSNAQPLGNQLVLLSLKYAFETEKKHKILYDKALAALQNNQVNTLSMDYFVCPTCGNTYDTVPPKRCGISMTSSEKFIKV